MSLRAGLCGSCTIAGNGLKGEDRAAALAEVKARIAAAGGGKLPSGPRRRKDELGTLDVETYLRHYGVGFEIKQKGAQTLYVLERCLFDPDHGGAGEAAIIASPTGTLVYSCLHASCKDKRWQDARAAISGDKKLSEFCAGYDPNWKPPAATDGSERLAAADCYKQQQPPAANVPPEKFYTTETPNPAMLGAIHKLMILSPEEVALIGAIRAGSVVIIN
jgi:hypothetical protein